MRRGDTNLHRRYVTRGGRGRITRPAHETWLHHLARLASRALLHDLRTHWCQSEALPTPVRRYIRWWAVPSGPTARQWIQPRFGQACSCGGSGCSAQAAWRAVVARRPNT